MQMESLSLSLSSLPSFSRAELVAVGDGDGVLGAKVVTYRPLLVPGDDVAAHRPRAVH